MPHRPIGKKAKRSSATVEVRKPTREEIAGAANSKNMLERLIEAQEAADIEAAVELAVSIVQTPNTSVEALDEAFQVLVQNGNLDMASSALKLALARDRVSVDAAYRFLDLFGVEGEVEHLRNAIGILSEYKTIKEHQTSLVYALGRLTEHFLTQSDVEHAHEVIAELESIDSVGIVTNIEKAAYFLVADQMEECAANALEAWAYFIDKAAIIEIKEDDDTDFNVVSNEFVPEEPFLIGLTRCLTALEEYDRAAAVCELALAQSEDDPVLLHEMAWIMNLQGDYDESKAYLEKALFIYEEQGAAEMVADIEQKLAQFK